MSLKLIYVKYIFVNWRLFIDLRAYHEQLSCYVCGSLCCCCLFVLFFRAHLQLALCVIATEGGRKMCK